MKSILILNSLPIKLLTSFVLYFASSHAAAQTYRKENFDDRIRQLKSQAIVTCEKHGGINCAAGPNPVNGGGVTCADGTKVKLSFAEYCSKSKLTSTIFVEDKGGTRRRIPDLRQFFMNGAKYPEFIVSVRNSSPAEAKDVNVSLIQGAKALSAANEGTKTIGAFGGEDFHLSIPPELFLDRYGVGRGVQIDVKCENC